MAREKENKTNVMRILDRAEIRYTPRYYEHNEQSFDGREVARQLGEDPERVFKTLVTVGKTGNHYVFVLPVCGELDLKAAAQSVGEKSVELIHVKDINKITGYIRGGCSPVGMKKQFTTVFDSSALSFDFIAVSGGKIGTQVLLRPDELIALVGAKTADITANESDALRGENERV